MEHAETVQYAAHASQLTDRARAALRTLNMATGGDAEDELQVMRLRCKKHEIIVTPTFDNGHHFSVIVVPRALRSVKCRLVAMIFMEASNSRLCKLALATLTLLPMFLLR